ncbi:tyrosine-protein phosphatase [Nocardia sp. NPDC058379]|uniref:tyrosine-protein phosphatase n=1 Tax=unclassified Nocardia TaxID=2637762 RepID=UPI003648DB36
MTRGTPTRRLEIGTTYNLRDVGGYTVDGGGTTRWGRLFRSDLPRLVPSEAEALRVLRLRTVLDLRDDDEYITRPSSFGGVEVQLVRRPLGLRALIDGLPVDDADPLGTLFCTAAQQLGRQIAAAIAELGRPGALPTLVHCAAGKDRTGIIIALTLGSIGVPDEQIAADFALSSTYLTSEFFAAEARTTAGPREVYRPALRGSEPASILRLLDEVRNQDGTVRDYLLRHGATTTELDALRAALIDSSDQHQL